MYEDEKVATATITVPKKYAYLLEELLVRVDGKASTLGRAIMMLEGITLDGLEVDHINKDVCDNSMTNLRITMRNNKAKNKNVFGDYSRYKQSTVSLLLFCVFQYFFPLEHLPECRDKSCQNYGLDNGN